MGKRVLLIEDEPGLIKTLTHRLAKEGYQVEIARDGNSGFDRAAKEAFDLILLDVMLPQKNGYDLCMNLRQLGVGTPIIMLTARQQVIDKVLGLKLGADDYVTKPFEMMELLARMEAQLRRAGAGPSSSPGEFQFGDVKVNFDKTEVERAGNRVEVSAQEFKLLCYFIKNRGVTLSRQRMLDDVWGYNAMPSTRTVDVHVAGLRQKIEPDPRHPKYIITVHGFGYKFVC